MKVFIGNYIKPLTPFIVAEKLCFWTKKDENEQLPMYVTVLGDFFAYGWTNTPAQLDIKDIINSINNSNKDEYTKSLNDYHEQNTACKSWFYKALDIFNKYNQRREFIHIDNYDVYDMSYTLSLIVLPMLIKLKENKHGSPFVCNEDVPIDLHSPTNSNKDVDELWHERWTWVIDEIIWGFEQIKNGDQLEYNQEYENRVQNAMKLFGKYFQNLWD